MVLNDQLQATAHILHMFHWVDQAIIIIQTHIHGKVVIKESSVQYLFGKLRNSPLMGIINILCGMFMHILSPSFLSIGLLRSQRAWRRMVVTVTGVHPVVTRGSTFEVFALFMGVIITGVSIEELS